MKKNIIQIALIIVIIVLAYFVYESIMGTVRFDKESARRKETVIQNLKDIRTIQASFKSVNNVYSSSFDTLVDFYKNGKIPVVKMEGDIEDTTAVIVRDTSYINVSELLFKNNSDFKIDSLPYIPYSCGKKFILKAGEIEKGNVKVQVFEAYAKKEYFLKGLDEKLFYRIDSLKVGSMTEASVDGNWE